jgi:nitroreductase
VKDPVFKLIYSRRSIRAFHPDDIPDDTIAQIISAGIWAPTGGNVQPWHFYLVRSQLAKEQLAAAALHQNFISQAPVVIVVCADTDRARSGYKSRGVTLYCLQDTAAAIQNMLLAIHALDLGACWVGAFSEEQVSTLLSLPPYHRPVALVPIGRPAERPGNPGRRKLFEVFTEVD